MDRAGDNAAVNRERRERIMWWLINTILTTFGCKRVYSRRHGNYDYITIRYGAEQPKAFK